MARNCLAKLVASLTLLLPTAGQATDFFWSSPASQFWSSSANWGGAGIPGAADQALLYSGGVTTSINVSNPLQPIHAIGTDSATCGGCTWTLFGQPLSFQGPGANLFLNGPINFSAGADIDASAVSLTIGGPGSVNVNFASLSGPGALILNSPATLTVGSFTATGFVTVAQGSATLSPNSGSNVLNLSGGTTRTSDSHWAALSGTGGTLLIDGIATFAGSDFDRSFTGSIGDNGAPGMFVKRGSKLLTLTGSHTYTGGTAVESGATLRFQGASGTTFPGGDVATDGTLWMSVTGTPSIGDVTGDGNLLVDAGSLTVNSLSLAGTVTVNSPANLFIASDSSVGMLAGDSSVTLMGNATFGSGNQSWTQTNPVGGTGSFSKVGTGTLTLSGTITAPLYLVDGTLVIDGAPVVAFAAVVGGTLTGTGAIGSVGVGGAGTVAPGAGVGTLSVGSIGTSGALAIQIEGTAAGTQHDQLIVGASAPTLNPGATLVLSGSYTPVLGDTFTIVRVDAVGPIAGTFTGLPEGATFNFNGIPLKISYVGGDGNDITLTVSPTPFILVSSNALVFANTFVTEETSSQTVTVTNNGTVLSTLNVGTITKSGTDATSFAFTYNDCTSPLAQGASCTFQVKFVPQSGGPKAAQVNIPSDDPANPTRTVALSGTGVVKLVTPDPFTFTPANGVARQVTPISNPITVSGINVAVPIKVTGGEYSIGCLGGFTSLDGMIGNTQTVCVRHTSSGTLNTPVTTTLKIGPTGQERTGTFTSTTEVGQVLTVQTVGTGNGKILGSGAIIIGGIDCGSDCTENYWLHESVQLTAPPFPGSVFAGWSGDCTGTGICTVTMDAARNVTATFTALIVYNVVLEGWQQNSPYVVTPASGSGTVIYNPVAHNITLNLTYSGLGSSEVGAHIHGPAARGMDAGVLFPLAAGSPKTQTFALDAIQEGYLTSGGLYVNIHTTNYANGEIRGQIDGLGATVTRPLTVQKGGTGSGTVTGTTGAGAVINCGSDCTETIPDGKIVTLTATPAAGSTFGGWSVDCGGPNTQCVLGMNGPKVALATFTPQVLNADVGVTISANPDPATVGVDSTFTFTVTNAGPGAATGVTLTLSVSGITITTPPSGCTAGIGPSSYSCTIGTLAASASSQVTVVGKPTFMFPILANGNVSSTSQDINFANNLVFATIQVNAPTRMSNISTRMQVLGGNDRMIAGFIIGGFLPKTVVVNVAGPNLVQYGITNALMDPMLTLVRSSDQSVIATNDDWQTQAIPGDVAGLTVSGFQPNDPKEPALIATLPPGAYTAIVEGVAGTTGVGLVGVFEVDHPETPLVNISTRGQVLLGNDVMIAGFIVQGTSSKTVVINVAGPNLVQYGIPNALMNPTLTIVRASDNTIVAQNDDWQTQTNPADVAAILATGFQPNNPAEPAVILTLPPGAYTAIVSGKDGGTGVGLVGVFAVP